MLLLWCVHVRSKLTTNMMMVLELSVATQSCMNRVVQERAEHATLEASLLIDRVEDVVSPIHAASARQKVQDPNTYKTLNLD